MKKIVFSLLLLLSAVTSFAQLDGDGFYFVQNYGSKRWAYLRDNYGKLDIGSQQADCSAIQMWKNQPLNDDPSAVIYIKNVDGNRYDLQGQGTGLHQLINYFVQVDDRSKYTKVPNTYWVYATSNGITKYLDDENTKSGAEGACGFNRTGDYRLWSVFKVDQGDNYLGVRPTVTVAGEAYAAYYVSFAFTKTPGMEVYYISKVDEKLGYAVLSEYKGDVVPAATPVLIKCPSSESAGNKISPLLSGGTAISGNLLKGVYFTTPERLNVTKDAATKYNASSMRVLGVTKSGKLGYINSTSSLYSENSVYYLNANQSYLSVPAGTPDELTIVTQEEYEEMTAYCNVSVTAGENGKVEVSPAGSRFKIGTTLTLTATPNTGYSFSAWSDGTKVNPYTYTVSKDATLSASFTVNQYSISFDTDGGSAVSTITQNYGSSITAPAAPTKTGYTFAGWDQAIPSTMPAQDMTLKAKWTINQYTITFNTNGGSDVASVTQDYGSAITKPADPTRTGYTFVGWDKEIPATMPADNVTVTAQWRANQYTISFDTDGGTEIAAVTKDYGTALTTPAVPTKTGYTFAGWDQTFPATMPAQDMTLKALWTINQYTITFNANGGTELAAITQDYASAITKPADPTRTGYTFQGWDKEIPASMPAANMTITAQWQVNQYTITFDVDGGSAVAAISQDYGSKVTAPAAPAKTGYTFAGWDVELPASMPAQDMVIKALWTVNQYTLTFDTKGGSAIPSVVYDYGSAVTVPENPTKLGYTFAGWDIEIPASMPAQHVTVSALWTPNQYRVAFLSEDEVLFDQLMDYGSVITAPQNPEREGYEFCGWSPTFVAGATVPVDGIVYTAIYKVNPYKIYYKVDGELYATEGYNFGETIHALTLPEKEGYTFSGWSDVPETMPANDVTVEGSFKVNQYKVSFLADGVEVSVENVDFGSEIILPAAPEKEGYTFVGWTPNVDATVPSHDVTYEAVYEVNTYKVLYYFADELLMEYEVAYGDIMPEYTWSPEAENIIFNAWLGETYETMPAHDVVYTADFTDAIRGIDAMASGIRIYTIGGQYVKTAGNLKEANLPAGIYVVNGRKVLVK